MVEGHSVHRIAVAHTRRHAQAGVGVRGRSVHRRSLAAQTPELEKHSGYKESELQACVRDMHEIHKNAATSSLQAVRKKYAQEKHGNVSAIAPASLRW